MRKLLIILFQLMLTNAVEAQDIHWSQFNDNPLFQNPGNAGNFNGDYRFVANYRDQWRSVTVPYTTLSLSADGKLAKHKNLGYGILFFHDVVGDGSLRTIELQGNVSYLIKLSKDSTHTVRSGLNIGMNHRQLNFDQLYFNNQYDGIQYNPSLSSNEVLSNDRKTNFSLGIGAVYEYYVNKRFNIIGGVGAYNLNKPNQGFYNDVILRDIRTNIFAKGIYKIGFDWDIIPSVNLSFQGKYNEIIFGSSFKYTLKDRLGEYRAFYAGGWFRNKDAGYLSLGMDYQSWFVGLSYDINFSKLVPASRARGGFEIAVRYILHRFKPKKIVHRICPDYI
ncbi:MAG: PorP/SprF family type IX secretion system membrane protein [Crocinitomicaceae bacterium]